MHTAPNNFDQIAQTRLFGSTLIGRIEPRKKTASKGRFFNPASLGLLPWFAAMIH